MPFYYDVEAASTSNASVNTESPEARLLTAANQGTCAIMGLYVTGRDSAAGGLQIRLKTYGTAGSAGSAYTPGKRHPNNSAAGTTAFTAHSIGTTAKVRQVVGCAAQGGFGGWFAATLEQAISLLPNGGANGNAELISICGKASTPFDTCLEFCET